MSVFVTVGTTSFDLLIKTLCSEESINLFVASGYKELVFQIGEGNHIPSENPLIRISWFRFKENVKDDISKASLIIGHAGAGTILETLSMNKPLIVVLNEELMHNHQGELALKLTSEGYLMSASCSSLFDILRTYLADEFVPSIYDPIKKDFSIILHRILHLK